MQSFKTTKQNSSEKCIKNYSDQESLQKPNKQVPETILVNNSIKSGLSDFRHTNSVRTTIATKSQHTDQKDADKDCYKKLHLSSSSPNLSK